MPISFELGMAVSSPILSSGIFNQAIYPSQELLPPGPNFQPKVLVAIPLLLIIDEPTYCDGYVVLERLYSHCNHIQCNLIVMPLTLEMRYINRLYAGNKSIGTVGITRHNLCETNIFKANHAFMRS